MTENQLIVVMLAIALMFLPVYPVIPIVISKLIQRRRKP